MKTKITGPHLLVSSALAGFMLLAGSSMAQQKPAAAPDAKKTITIHVVKEVDGKKIVIDTTMVTSSDFDADSFLHEKGITDEVPAAGEKRDEHIIIRQKGDTDLAWENPEDKMPDTIKFDGDRIIVLRDTKGNKMHDRRHEMPFPDDFNFQHEFPPMHPRQYSAMMDEMLQSFGLEDVAPFGEMKQVVVKKKRNGKKVIITFEDREGRKERKGEGNKKEERVIIYNNGEQGMIPGNEERVIIEGNPGEKTVITKHVVTDGNQKRIIVKANVDDAAPAGDQKKVIVIEEKEVK